MPKSYSIVAMDHCNSSDTVEHMKPGDDLFLVREPTNQYDKNAIAVYLAAFGIKIGYIPKKQNAMLAAFIDQKGEHGMAFDGVDSARLCAKFVRSPNSGYPMVEV